MIKLMKMMIMFQIFLCDDKTHENDDDYSDAGGDDDDDCNDNDDAANSDNNEDINSSFRQLLSYNKNH